MDDVQGNDINDKNNILSGLNIMLVEDNYINQIITKEIIEKKGGNIYISSNGKEAIKFLLSTPEKIDLILMDIQMPEMDGYEATRQIRQLIDFANLPIIAMTANSNEEDKVTAKESGMNDHITKPFNNDLLFEKILIYTGKKSFDDKKYEINDSTFKCDKAIDIRIPLRRLGKNKELVKKIILDFYLKYKNIDKEIYSLIKDKKIKELNILFHTIKGLAATIGANKFSEYARLLEEITKSDNLENIDESLIIFFDELHKLIGAIEMLNFDNTNNNE